MGEQHALRAWAGQVDQRADAEGPVADVHRLLLGHLRGPGEVGVALARRGQLRPRRDDDLQGGPVIEREGPVLAGFGEPQVDQLPELLGMLGGQVVQFGAIGVGVVQLPGVVVEVAPAAERGVGGDGFPAVVPDPAGAEHRVELGFARRGRRFHVGAVTHAHAVEPALHMALDRRGALHPQGVQDGRHDVDGVMVLVADLAPAGRRPSRSGPGDDARVGGAAVELVPLPHLERRVERHRPAVRVVVVGPRPAELVQHGQVRRHVIGDPVSEFHFVY